VRVSRQVGGGDIRDREVVDPWKCPPHSSFAFARIALALVRAAWLPFATPALAMTYVHVVPRWHWGCPAKHLRARLSAPSLYPPFSERPCATGFAAWGSRGGRTRGGRREGRCPLRARSGRLRRLHTIIDVAASCSGGTAARPRGGGRDGLRSAAPSMVRRTSRRAGMWVGSAHPAARCMGQLRGGMHRCGTRSDVSACYRARWMALLAHMAMSRSAMRQCAPPTCEESGL
jgi:hypothetical protein